MTIRSSSVIKVKSFIAQDTGYDLGAYEQKNLPEDTYLQRTETIGAPPATDTDVLNSVQRSVDV